MLSPAFQASLAEHLLRLPRVLELAGFTALLGAALSLGLSFQLADDLAQGFFLGAFACALGGASVLLLFAKYFQGAERRRLDDLHAQALAHFRHLVEDAAQGILIHRAWRPLFANRAFSELLGFDSPQAVLALPRLDGLIEPAALPRLRALAEHPGEGAGPVRYEAVRTDGSRLVLEDVIRRVCWCGEPATQHTLTDVTVAERAERSVRASEARFRDFADIAADWFAETDAALRLTYVSERFPEVTGAAVEAVLGLTPEELFTGASGAPVARAMRARESFDDLEIEWPRGDGTSRILRLSARPYYDAAGQFRGYRGVGRDVTEAHRLAVRLSYQATHDSLTGLVNRGEFEHRLQRVLETAREEDTEHALCFLDLDQFKVINDTCGHVAGDALLRQLGRQLPAHVRQRDTLARLGGDEFGVLLEHCTVAQAERTAAALLAAVSRMRFDWEGRSFTVGVSIGLAPINAASGSLTAVLSAADSSCYAAKESGRNRVRVYRADDALLAQRRDEVCWAARLNEALAGGGFVLVRQAIAPVDASAARGAHFELLVRMRGHNGELIPPGAFLPAAERFNLASRIDRWVVDTALRWLARDPANTRDLYLCAINLSGQSVAEAEFLDFVVECFDRTGLDPHKICFEITETAAIGNLAQARRLMQTLGAMGCRFALDDFGSGLSSFAYLRTLPAEFVKIDGSFVRHMLDDPLDLALVRSINEIGQAMGKKTIAEFVETEAILRELALPALGVDYAQGYGVGMPEAIEGLG